MSLVKVKAKAQITLPVKIRQKLGIEEGDYLRVAIEDDRIVLMPQALVSKLPPVTLSEQGERMLQEAFEDIRQGRVGEHDSADSLLGELHHEAD